MNMFTVLKMTNIYLWHLLLIYKILEMNCCICDFSQLHKIGSTRTDEKNGM